MILYTEGFGRFVSSTTAPIATGWSESYRGGLPTAHWGVAPFHGAPHSWHTQSELDTFLPQQRLTASSPRLCRFPRGKVACHTCARFCVHPSPLDAKRSDARSKAPGPSCLGSRLCLHKFFSKSCGVGPELSYTAQLSARGRYIRSKFTQLLENLRMTLRRGASWPPCRTRPAIRRRSSRVVCSRRYTISTR